MAAPTLVSATWISGGTLDGVVLRTVLSTAVTVVGAPTFDNATRGQTANAMAYKAGTGTATIDWWVTDANYRVFANETAVLNMAANTVTNGTPNGTITGAATTNQSLATSPSIGYKAAAAGKIRVYCDLFGNGADVSYAGLPVLPIVNFSYSAGEADTLAHFITALASKIPDPAATGVATIDNEQLDPASGDYADYDTDPTWPANRDIRTSILDYARANRPGYSWGPYQRPNLFSAIVGDATARANRLLYSSRSYGLVEVVGHSDNIQPEMFPRDLTFTQSQTDDFARYSVGLARAVNTLAFPRISRPVYLFIYLNGPDSPFTDLTVAQVAMNFAAAQKAGADGVIFGASESLKTAAQWQVDAQTRQRQALLLSGVLQSESGRRARRGR